MRKPKGADIRFLPKKKPFRIGLVEWFRIGEEERVKNILADLKAIAVTNMRTGFSWAEWYSKEGQEWYKWLIPQLAKSVNILPCFTYTPPQLGIEPKVTSPPRNPAEYAFFIEDVMKYFGQYFQWVELWNEPNNINDWDWRLDPSWEVFSEMIRHALRWLKEHQFRTVLGGMSPIDPNWIEVMCSRGVMDGIDAVGIHGFPGTWEFDWSEWPVAVNKVREVLSKHELSPEIWITASGYSTWRHDEFRQVKNFAKFLEAPVQRAYWYSAQDLHPDKPFQEVFHGDERHYHFGLKYADGRPKLLFRLWAKEGLPGILSMAKFGIPAGGELKKPSLISVKKNNSARQSSRSRKAAIKKPVLITGGAGFIGTNLAHRLLSSGERVIVFDNLSRPGVEENLQWLLNAHGDRLDVKVADIRNQYAVKEAVQIAGHIYHFAAQVAVTTSMDNPLNDFEINLQGTINLLEAVRTCEEPVPLLYTSTNKVYGGLPDINLARHKCRYEPVNLGTRKLGIDEARQLDFHSPYGCSKGSADQYVLDYARIYNMPNLVFRMSCIYGPHQFGTEDQGWIAFFLIKALQGEQITIFGDGYQVRDILYVEDLIDAQITAHEEIDFTRGQAFNIGGGPENTVSLLEVLDIIEELTGKKISVQFSQWRQGDQKYYVSNTNKFGEITGWYPKINAREGIEKLFRWLSKYRRQAISENKVRGLAQ